MKIADRYEPTGAAHWGGMSEVHECIDHHLGRHVMLKRVKNKKDLSRLLDEKKSLMLLRSKHVMELMDIVSYSYAGELESGLILEKITGSDLEEENYNPGVTYKRILWQIASGLSDIHEAGVIHRDIKPPNIRVDMSGVLKILDFGLSREIGKDNHTRSIAGTKRFMAPELFGTSTIKFTEAVDVYAFGVTAAVLLRHLAGQTLQPVDASSTNLVALYPGLDSDTAAIISSCVRRSPQRRPEIKDVKAALGRSLLYNKHRAQIVYGTSYELNASNTSIRVNSSSGGVEIDYNGYEFVIKAVSGQVFVNNQIVQSGYKMLDACVITLGGNTGAPRAFLTFDISNPEV